MLTTKRTRSSNIDFQTLVKALDADLKIRDGEEHDFYHQFYKIDMIQNVVVAYAGDEPIGCGAVKEYSSDSMEVKRMYVPPQHRGKGIASIVLKELESWCKELGYKKCILETGKKQPEAIELYKKNGYIIIPNYGQYSTIANSVCFEKELTK
ncbi:MAG: GNAT family N-acetyltransferase [Chitinophagaceae bacterium]|nr:GNAT family N-acetyltransferase [Chitinophagaceae bacterium]MBK8310732.1 GNAT family N-acetyltransferase [Chitinophagaceae bacterium]MBK8607287.1 GNAT family N-acetyltransferase [Chitinophagaceae bacterium]MBP6477939.1 GNAT family N-acetyltransferase [Chitinophagaceae bacterium]MBP7108775.1 GNAT family N-acetyltransferase [Chitinophagaceae bacterium]